ncbi:MAG TPA: SH3 domain-containing protein, partial [Longimicrobiales bacterium]|nr:SH3 domain-containing protein [Longimicrobiales bacterium]
MSSTFVVKPLGLNLRSEPEVRADTRLAVLNQGQEVTALGPKSNGWMRVSATVGGRSFEGWVSAAHLVATGRSEEPERHTGVAPVHLAAHREARRDRDSRWAFPIGEGGAPRRNPDASPSQKARSLLKIVDWLDVEHSARYRPTSRSTYCNIYAYDYCFL